MALFAWDEKYSVRIQKIDDQHQTLFNAFAELTEAMQAGQGKTVLGKVFADLLEYTKTHFAYEELLLRTYGYADYAMHQKLHADFVKQVHELERQFREGKALPVRVSVFLRDWLTNHILKIDHQYSAFLRSKGVK